jgi:hypothetical protein
MPESHFPRIIERSRCPKCEIRMMLVAVEPCAYRKSNPDILVVQSAQNRVTENASNRLGGA